MNNRMIQTVLKKIHICFLMLISAIMVFATRVKASPENEEEVKKKLSEILEPGSASASNAVETESLWEIFQEKIIEFLENIWEKLDISRKFGTIVASSQVSNGVLMFIRIFTIVIMVVLIALIVYFITKKITRSRAIKQEEDALILNTIKDPDTIYKKALEYCNNGEYTQAMRFLYIASLIYFNSLNIIRINKAKTNKQYLGEIRDNRPEVYDTMVEFTQIFNRHWYGKKSVEQSMFIMWRDKYSQLMDSIK